jgi:hypothetical protein
MDGHIVSIVLLLVKGNNCATARTFREEGVGALNTASICVSPCLENPPQERLCLTRHNCIVQVTQPKDSAADIADNLKIKMAGTGQAARNPVI